ncbi:hypothetical protein [Euzebya tangerina]|uniref:hypothetical protein n=1 Tax=Euzebya tangerina TaxID=591198 RepID=UPI00196AB29F|nr:hypothetical protein [Euzebya tangerina]
MRHRTEDTRTYPCQVCGGELEFHIGEQRLRCPSCGTTAELAEVTGQVVENDLRAALAAQQQRQAGHQSLVQGEKEIVCQNCGGHTTFTGTWTAQRCPYCATPIQRDDVHDAPERLPVDAVLPFTVDQRTAEGQLKDWVSSRWFAPTEFKEYSRAGSFQSVYTAYFTYDAETETTYRGQRGDNYTVTVGSGQNRRTETRTRWRPAAGRIQTSFDDVAVLANTGLNTRYVNRLEPWPMEQVRPFSPEFLAGHLSRTYDHTVDHCLEDAQRQMDQVITQQVRRDIGGDHQRIHHKDTRWGAMTFKHVLLPIWLLTVIYGGATYQVMINGTTGEVVGERPYSKVKIAAAVAIAILIVIIIAVARSG